MTNSEVTAVPQQPHTETPHWKEPQDAFNEAIQSGRLSTNKLSSNYAGLYMYMGPTVDGKQDAFKHIATREYLPLVVVAL